MNNPTKRSQNPARAFGTSPSQPKWDPRADVNIDRIVVDFQDINTIARNFGKQDP